MANRSGESRAEQNRRIRKEALIEQLRNKGLCQQVIETCEKLADLNIDLSSAEIQRLKAANDGRLALVKKYLPDAKAIEITGEDGEAIKIESKTILANMDQEKASELYKEMLGNGL